MSRRSFLVAVGIVCFLACTVSASLLALLHYEPGHYRRAAIPSLERRGALAKEFWTEFSEFVSAVNNPKNEPWYASFTDEQINSALEGKFMTGDTALPEGILAPRIVFQQDRLLFAFRYRSRLVNTVVSIATRIWLPQVENNVVAVQLEGFRAGALPFRAQWLLEQFSEAARPHGIEVNWYRHEGNPVALLRFQADLARPTLQLTAIQLEQGRITIHGRAAAERAALPFPVLALLSR